MSTTVDDHNAATRVEAMRASLRPYWDPSEAGGIFLIGVVNDDEANLAAFARLFPLFPTIDIASDTKWEFLAWELAKVARYFFEHAQLSPGAYELANYHVTFAKNGQLQLNQWNGPPIEVPSQTSFMFEVTREHLALMRRMNIREYHGNVELMDCKRPYGDMTYFYIDMAEALGEPVPRNAKGEADFAPETQARYSQLHGQMLFAVQAFWKHARA